MSSSQTDNSDDQQHASDSVEYSGVGGGVFPKRRGKVFLIVGLMSVVVVVIVFLIVGFVSYRDAATAQAHNAGPSQLAAANAENCANPCRSPHFFCHPASEKDDKGCFEPGCACFPEHCHKRCPPGEECVLGSPVDYRGCFRPNCKCETISPASPANNCSSVCPAGERCLSSAPKDAQGCPLPGCACEPDCMSPCPFGRRCRPGSPVDSKGCYRPGCICEPDCVPRCLPGLECAASSPRDHHGCFLSGCVCELTRKYGYRARATTPRRCISPCPFGKECIENSTRDERGCFQRGCICEVKCPQRCPLNYRCRPNSPKDIEGCFLYGCPCEPVPDMRVPPNQMISGSSRAPGELSPPRAGSLFPLGDDKALPIGVDQDFNSSIDFRYNRRVIPRNKSETTVDAVSVHGHTDPSADVSSHIPTPGETHTTGDVPVNSVNSSSEHQRPSVSAAVPVTHLGGTSSSDAKESPVQHSNASSPTLSHRATQIPDVDNASMTVSASQSTVETPAVTLPAVSGNVSDGSTSNVDDTPGTVNTSSPLDDDDDDDEDDGVLGNVGSEDSKDGNAQNTTLERRHDSENATLGKSDNAGAMEGGEQGSPRHETDSTFKTSEDTEDAASTISSQQAGEGHRSSTTVDHHASDATSEGTAQGHHTPLTAASEDIRN